MLSIIMYKISNNPGQTVGFSEFSKRIESKFLERYLVLYHVQTMSASVHFGIKFD